MIVDFEILLIPFVFQDQRDSVLGFGFGKRRKYFTAVKQLPKQVKVNFSVFQT